VISWQGEFFINGHTIEYLDSMNYWTFLEITDGINTSRSQQPSGKTRTKKISKSQMVMKEARIKQREKEGIKHG
jgi:hypothetical protein